MRTSRGIVEGSEMEGKINTNRKLNILLKHFFALMLVRKGDYEQEVPPIQ